MEKLDQATHDVNPFDIPMEGPMQVSATQGKYPPKARFSSDMGGFSGLPTDWG